MGSPPASPPPTPPAASRPDYGLATLVSGIVAVVALFVAFFVTPNPIPFLFVSLATGATALVLGLQGRRGESMGTTGVVLGGSAIAGTLLFAIVWVAGILVFLVLMLLVFFLFFWTGPQYSSGSSCDCSGCRCQDSGSSSSCCSSCDCGSCANCGSCDCGGCGGGCGGCGGGGCGCVALLGITSGAAGRMAPLMQRGGDRFAHHPDSPAFAADVYVVRGVRYCIGCFTTFPLLFAATLALAFVPAPAVALPLGVALASAQLLSSAGLAKERWVKASVKSALAIGLALVIAGVRAAPWAPQAKVLVLAGAAALALASTIPRARRMRAAKRSAAATRNGCTCATPINTGTEIAT